MFPSRHSHFWGVPHVQTKLCKRQPTWGVPQNAEPYLQRDNLRGNMKLVHVTIKKYTFFFDKDSDQDFWDVFSPPARWGLLDFMSVACSSPPLLLLLLNRDPRRTVFSVGPQPRPSTPSVPCRTSTTTIPAQCSLPDLNHDHPRPVFPAGPQPRVSTPSVPCRTSCRKIWDKECAEES